MVLNDKISLESLAKQKEIIIGESYGHFREYDMSKLYAYPTEEFNKKSYSHFLDKMENRYDDFVSKLYDTIQYSAEKVMNNCIKKHFEIIDNANKDNIKVQQSELELVK